MQIVSWNRCKLNLWRKILCHSLISILYWKVPDLPWIAKAIFCQWGYAQCRRMGKEWNCPQRGLKKVRLSEFPLSLCGQGIRRLRGRLPPFLHHCRRDGAHTAKGSWSTSIRTASYLVSSPTATKNREGIMRVIDSIENPLVWHLACQSKAATIC